MFNESVNVLSVLTHQFSWLANWSKASVELVSGGFSGAGVFRIESEGASYCLRRWPSGQSSSRLLAIHQLLKLAHGCGVSAIPVPLKSDIGTTLAKTDDELWQLEPWMPGEADFQSLWNDERLKSAMTHLGRFHNAIRDWVPTTPVSQWFQPASTSPCPTICNRIQMIDGYVSLLTDFDAALILESDSRFRDVGSQVAVVFRTAQARVKRELMSVQDLPVLLQPCIRDIWCDHLLFQGNELTGIVDFGAMATDSVACDLSRLLGSLFGDDFNSWQRALKFYEAVRPMSDAEHRLLRQLDKSSVLLSGMTWLKRRYVLRNTPTDLSRVCDRLDTVVERMTTLALDS